MARILRNVAAALLLAGTAIVASAVPDNDNFADATALGDITPEIASGNNTGATAEPGEPGSLAIPGPGPAQSIWWSWVATANATVRIDANPGEIPWDPVLHVYTGTDLANLTQVAANDDAPNAYIGESSVQFPVTIDTTYWIQVDGQNGGAGEVTLRLSQRPPANDNFGGAIDLDPGALPVIESATNAGATLQTDEPDPDGPGGRSLWWSFTPDSDGYYAADVSGSVVDAILYVFTGEHLEGLRPTGWSANGQTIFYGHAGQTYWIAVHGRSEEEGEVELDFDAAPTVVPPANDLFEDAIAIAPATLNATVTGNNIDATLEAWEPQEDDFGLATHSVWWSWTAPADGYVEANTFGSDFDTILHAFDGATVRDLRLLAANDQASGGGDQSQAAFYATANTTYHFSVSGWFGSAGNVTLNLLPDTSGLHPSNDLFADADDLGSAVPASSTIGAEGATVEHGEPASLVWTLNPELLREARSIWWKWTAPAAGYYRVDAGGDFSGSVAGYTGNTLATLDYLGDAWYRFDFRAEAGETFYFQVWTWVWSTGGVTLEVTDSPSGLALDYLGVDPGTVDVGLAPATANVTLQLTSPGSFAFGEIRFLDPATGQAIAAVQRNFWDEHRVSGDALAGNYTVETEFRPGTPAGVGRFNVLLYDQTYFPTFIRTPIPVPGNGTVTVVNTEAQDLLPPALTGVTWERRQGDVTFGPDVIQVQIGVTDDQSGPREGWLRVIAPDGVERDVHLADWSYDEGTSSFSASVEFAEFSPAGHYRFSLIVRDWAGRESVYGADRIGSVDLLNFGQVDDLGPEVTYIFVNPDPVDVTSASANITVSLGITDLIGFNYGFVDIMNPSGSQLLGQFFDASQATAGGPNNGAYNIVLTLPEGLPSGSYSCRVFVVDVLGRSRAFSIYPADESFSGESDPVFLVLGSASSSPYDTWIASFMDPLSPEAARGYDAEDDGLDNLTELVFGLNPTVNDSDDPDLPRVIPDGDWLILEFTVDPTYLSSPGYPPITYTGEWSASLAAPWTSVAPTLVSGNTYRVRVPIDGDPRKFLRLRIHDPSGP